MTQDKPGFVNFRIAIPPKFEVVFTHFYFAENRTGTTIVKTLLPSYQTILIFNFGAKAILQLQHDTPPVLDNYLIIGPVKRAFQYTLPPDAEILTVNFKDDAFYRLFRSIDTAEHVPTGPNNKNYFGILWYELSKMKNADERANCILEFCTPFFSCRNKIAEQLANFNEQALNPIKAIASRNKQTERNAQLNHKKHFGYSAKEHNRYQRFLKAVEFIEVLATGVSKVNWSEIVSECGYYDQSQLIHDFKYYINLSPSRYLQFKQDICNPIS